MAERESAAAERNDEETTNGTTAADHNQIVIGSKPLHRFVRGEPKCVGIAILFFGCAEVLMGFVLAKVNYETSNYIYIPFWQGALFLISGNLSIYTELHLSKKMVTVCLAMYIVALLGIPVSIGNRLRYLYSLDMDRWYHGPYVDEQWAFREFDQLMCIEAMLLTFSIFVTVLLIFLIVMARLALKSTNTQIVIQHVLSAVTDAASD